MEDILPTEFELAQNYPYPFKETTTIKYSVPIKSVVRIIVFNFDRKVVKKLVNKIQDVGSYEIQLNNSNLTEKDYYCEFKAFGLRFGSVKKINRTKKIILLK